MTSYFTSAMGQIPCSTERIASLINDPRTFRVSRSKAKCRPTVITGVILSVHCLSGDAFLQYSVYFRETLGSGWGYPLVVHLEIFSNLYLGFVAMATYQNPNAKC